MKRYRIASVASLAVSAGLMGLALAAPAQADPETDAFLSALTNSGITGVDPATAVSVGQQVCPMLAEPGQRMADSPSRCPSPSVGRWSRRPGPRAWQSCCYTGRRVFGGQRSVAIPLGLLGI